MIGTILPLLTALGFGVGTVMALLGAIFIHQLFIQGKQFKSQMFLIAASLTIETIGLTLLWLVLV